MLLAPARIVRDHFGFDEAHDRVAKHFEVVVHPGNDIGVHARNVNESAVRRAVRSIAADRTLCQWRRSAWTVSICGAGDADAREGVRSPLACAMDLRAALDRRLLDRCTSYASCSKQRSTARVSVAGVPAWPASDRARAPQASQSMSTVTSPRARMPLTLPFVHAFGSAGRMCDLAVLALQQHLDDAGGGAEVAVDLERRMRVPEVGQRAVAQQARLATCARGRRRAGAPRS